jgi:ankyrin repeat protein
LIETHGADVNVQDKYNNTSVHLAFCEFNPHNGGDITVLAYLINQKGINGNIKDWQGCTLLHSACDNINNLPLEIFTLLIETIGFDINVQDNSGDTPLCWALEHSKLNDRGDITVLMYLFNQKGVNANIKDRNGLTLLHLACICDLAGPRNDFTGSEDDVGDNFVKLNAENDTTLCQVVEFIAERCVQRVLDETTS